MEYKFFDYETFIAKQTEKRALKRTALAIGLSIITYFLSTFVVNYLLFAPTLYLLDRVTTIEMYDVVYECYTILSYMLPIILSALPIIFIVRIPFRVAFPIRRVPARVSIPAVMTIFGCTTIGITITAVLLSIFSSTGLNYDVPSPAVPQTTIGLVLYFVHISVLPAFLEEFLSRGLILQSLRRFGDWFAIIISALVFALTHANFLQLSNAFILGIALGFVTVRTGSIAVGMVFHFLNNFIISAIDIFITPNVNMVNASIVNLAYLGICFLMAVIGVSILISTVPGFFELRKPDSPLTRGERTKAFFLQPVSLTALLLLFGFCFKFFGLW